jgi:hypothetical protein
VSSFADAISIQDLGLRSLIVGYGTARPLCADFVAEVGCLGWIAVKSLG